MVFLCLKLKAVAAYLHVEKNQTNGRKTSTVYSLLKATGRGVAGQGPRVVCERFLEKKVHAAQSTAGREAPLRPAGGLGGRCKPPKWGSGQRPGKFWKSSKFDA